MKINNALLMTLKHIIMGAGAQGSIPSNGKSFSVVKTMWEGPWWWSSGQRDRILFQQSDLESCGAYSYFL